MSEEVRAELLKWLRMRLDEENAALEASIPYDSESYELAGAADAFAEAIARVEAMS